MANETYQIDNPTGGPPITIPAWASEETMRTIAMDAKHHPSVLGHHYITPYTKACPCYTLSMFK